MEIKSLMNVDPRFRDIVKAVALGESATAQSIGAELDADEHEQLSIFATAVMSVCLDHRFRDDHSLEAIRGFVEEMRGNYAKSNRPLKFFVIEGVIRAFAGEEDILDDISAEDQMRVNYPVIRKIVSDSSTLREKLDDVMHDAELLMAEWMSEDE